MMDKRIRRFSVEEEKYSENYLELNPLETGLMIKLKEETTTCQNDPETYESIVFPYRLLPSLIGSIKRVFGERCWFAELRNSNDRYRLGMDFLERDLVLKDFSIVHNTITPYRGKSMIRMNIPKGTVPYEVEKRMPVPEIVWLVENIRDVYNEWQERHPAEPRTR